jgi:hypothetical protein
MCEVVHAVEILSLERFHETRPSNDVLIVIYEDACNYHLKEVIAFGYDIK